MSSSAWELIEMPRGRQTKTRQVMSRKLPVPGFVFFFVKFMAGAREAGVRVVGSTLVRCDGQFSKVRNTRDFLSGHPPLEAGAGVQLQLTDVMKGTKRSKPMDLRACRCC